MNPVDTSIKALPEAASTALQSTTDLDDDTRCFGQVLSNQIANEKQSGSSAEITIEGSDKAEQDRPQSSDSKNSTAENLIGMVASQMLHSERLQTTAAEDIPDDGTVFFKRASTNAVLEPVKGSWLLPATQAAKTIDESVAQQSFLVQFPSIPHAALQDASKKLILEKTSVNAQTILQDPKLTGVAPKSPTSIDKAAELLDGLITAPFADSSQDSEAARWNISSLNSTALLTTPLGSSVTTFSTNPVHTSISAPINSQAGEQLVQQVKHLIMERIGLAEIQITPQELGPIRVEIALDKNEASIHFSAQHQETRDALSQHMNRLKESLAEVGMQLQSATTGSYSDGQEFSFFQQQAREKNNPETHKLGASQNAQREAAEPGLITVKPSRDVRRSSIDLFA